MLLYTAYVHKEGVPVYSKPDTSFVNPFHFHLCPTFSNEVRVAYLVNYWRTVESEVPISGLSTSVLRLDITNRQVVYHFFQHCCAGH
jgi:hypothetical protein